MSILQYSAIQPKYISELINPLPLAEQLFKYCPFRSNSQHSRPWLVLGQRGLHIALTVGSSSAVVTEFIISPQDFTTIRAKNIIDLKSK